MSTEPTASRTLRVAAVQMVSAAHVETNLATAEALIAEAAATGAQLIALPEYFCLMGMKDTDKVAVREPLGSGPIQEFLAAQARRHGIWLVGGTLPLQAPEADRVLNTTLVFDPQGAVVARYDEAVTIAPGRKVSTFSLEPAGGPALKVGLSICYDLRFPELYRAMGKPDLILVPAAFTATTGRAHWEVLLRARAIENLAYVLAPAQGGRHENGRATFGHSMLIDPWGEVIANRPDGAGVVFGDIDPQVIARCRSSLPALTHRVM
jgi:deaminated glutathione amidase